MAHPCDIIFQHGAAFWPEYIECNSPGFMLSVHTNTAQRFSRNAMRKIKR